ncbi:Hypothetical predicted protein, partial [Paramuricea clavata]
PNQPNITVATSSSLVHNKREFPSISVCVLYVHVTFTKQFIKFIGSNSFRKGSEEDQSSTCYDHQAYADGKRNEDSGGNVFVHMTVNQPVAIGDGRSVYAYGHTRNWQMCHCLPNEAECKIKTLRTDNGEWEAVSNAAYMVWKEAGRSGRETKDAQDEREIHQAGPRSLCRTRKRMARWPFQHEGCQDITSYQSMVGSLIYLAIATRPDIAYAVAALAKFNSSPTEAHLTAVKRVFRYLKGTAQLRLQYQETDANVEGYSDTDWASDSDDRRSTSGNVFVMSDLQMDCTTATTIYEDNQGAIALSRNPVLHKRTKHIDIKCYFVREKTQDGTVELKYCPTNEMVADILTKPLSKGQFGYLRCKLGVIQGHVE